MTFSIICPIYNEIFSIESLLILFESITPKPNEIFLVDGNSTDGTRDIIEKYSKKCDNLILLNNPNRTVPFALNIAIPLCTGDIIVRLDAHTEYSPEYFIAILQTFSQVDADIVGGPMRTKFKSEFQESVAYATSQKFGIGDSDFHFSNFSGYTSSVYLGAWKKMIFEKIGYFDTRFKRNQDDEFHYRANDIGLKVYQNSNIRSWYYPRNSIKKLFSQYFQYGLYKPMVLAKISSGIRVRHFIPSGMVLYLFLLSCLVIIQPRLVFYLASIPLALYLIIDFYFSFSNKKRLIVKINNLLVFPILHLAYGLGMILGLFKLIGFDRKKKY